MQRSVLIWDFNRFQASIESPANIPVVLSFPSVLYQTQGGTQDEVALPLGTVVNAVFKNQAWLYVQTPHGQEGYVGYAGCLPLGILPQPTRGPCWENSTDVFPRPLGETMLLTFFSHSFSFDNNIVFLFYCHRQHDRHGKASRYSVRMRRR